MHHKSNSACAQRRIKHHTQTVDSHSFFNVLTSRELLSTVEKLSPPFRERTFPPTETLSMFLSQALSADRSCQHIVNQSAIQRLAMGLTPHSTRTGSYCKARHRLPVDMVAELTRCTSRLIDEQLPVAWRWRGRPVRLVDGTTVIMPDTAQNQAAYPQQQQQKAGVGFPICRIVGILCLSSGSVMNAAMGPYKGKGGDEQSLLRGMLDTFENGDIVVGDAYYATYFLLAELISRGVDGLFEQHGGRRKGGTSGRGARDKERDHRITYTKPAIKPGWMSDATYQAAPATLTVREVTTGGKVLITTLLSATDTPAQALKSLYKDRWQVELDIRAIKTTMGMETFSSKSPAMVEKEMWVYLLAYNLVRLVMAQSAALADILPRTISFKHSLQLWQTYRQLTAADDVNLGELFVLIAEITVGHRPGRIEPRALKRRPKPYPLLMQQRSVAREAIKKFGHPKKQR